MISTTSSLRNVDGKYMGDKAKQEVLKNPLIHSITTTKNYTAALYKTVFAKFKLNRWRTYNFFFTAVIEVKFSGKYAKSLIELDKSRSKQF